MKDKGNDLEAQIEQFFAQNDYETTRNVILVGRSGGRHEIDVLAKKSDGITDFSVMVECKAWNHPIEKDIVSKVAYVVGDLGLNKGIIVSLEGWRIGAEQAGKELGIDLWDAFELEKRLGQVLVAELKGAGPRRHALGLRAALSRQQGEAELSRQRTGMFGKEVIEWVELVWLPFFRFDIRLAQQEKRLLGGTRVKSTRVVNVYEALSGEWTGVIENEALLEDVEDANIVPPRVTDRMIVTTINRECARLSKLVSKPAIERQQAKVRSLGIPRAFDTVSVDATSQLVLPYYIGLFGRKGKQRLVAIDALGTGASKKMTGVLTENLSYVLEALRREA